MCDIYIYINMYETFISCLRANCGIYQFTYLQHGSTLWLISAAIGTVTGRCRRNKILALEVYVGCPAFRRLILVFWRPRYFRRLVMVHLTWLVFQVWIASARTNKQCSRYTEILCRCTLHWYEFPWGISRDVTIARNQAAVKSIMRVTRSVYTRIQCDKMKSSFLIPFHVFALQLGEIWRSLSVLLCIMFATCSRSLVLTALMRNGAAVMHR